ncbi:hypothetical protein DHD08_00375 [Arenibacter sp. H213]|nr:hypothetical protein [Arenibacter sp. H213]
MIVIYKRTKLWILNFLNRGEKFKGIISAEDWDTTPLGTQKLAPLLWNQFSPLAFKYYLLERLPRKGIL